eukprot:4223332-Lingulodinium_polyedra.AAC.1
MELYGLHFKPSKCASWRPRGARGDDNPIIAGIAVGGGLAVLGSEVMEGSATKLGEPEAADAAGHEEQLALDPASKRAERAKAIAEALRKLARTKPRPRAAHV